MAEIYQILPLSVLLTILFGTATAFGYGLLGVRNLGGLLEFWMICWQITYNHVFTAKRKLRKLIAMRDKRRHGRTRCCH
jgi:hypothetical protein